MKNLSLLFSVLCALSLIFAFVIGCLFISAILIGGHTAEMLSGIAYVLMRLSMYSATAAVLVGLVNIYLTKSHELRFEIKKK